MERDGREPEGVEVRPADGICEAKRNKERGRPGLFSELGIGIPTREVVSQTAGGMERGRPASGLTQKRQARGVSNLPFCSPMA